MKKRIWRFFALCCALAVLVSSAPPAWAASDVVASGNCGTTGTNGSDVTWSLNNKGTLTISGKGDMKDYGTQDNKRRTSAAWGKEASSITEIVITKGVTTIGKCAFYKCTNAANVTIADSVLRVKSAAFFGCERLTKVTLPDSVSLVDDSTFQDCSNLVNIALPDGLTSIGNSAFAGCTHLTEMTLPATVNNVGDSVFRVVPSFKASQFPVKLT